MGRGNFSNASAGEAGYRGNANASTDKRHEEILEAAAEVICREGFDRTRIAQIAETAGVSGGTVIYHFGTLDRLLVESVLHAERRFYGTAEAIASDDRKAPRERLRLLMKWLFSSSDGNPQLWALWIETWAQATRHPDIAAARVEQDGRWRTMLRDLVSQSAKDASVVDRFVVSFAAFLDGLIILVALDDPQLKGKSAESIALDYASAVLGW